MRKLYPGTADDRGRSSAVPGSVTARTPVIEYTHIPEWLSSFPFLPVSYTHLDVYKRQVIRPQRYTIEFVEQNNTYSLCFFDESYKKMLGVAGSKSGRDINKMTELGLTPVFEDGTVWFKEASIVLICSKKYIDNIKPENFIDKSIINDFYPQNDFHKAFIGKIEKVYMK